MNLSILDVQSKMYAGIDAGNTKTKVSFLNKNLEFESFGISTVIAPASSNTNELKDVRGSKRLSKDEDKLHFHIRSDALPHGERDSYFYIGEHAKDKPERNEPNGEEKSNSKLHVVMALAGLAVAAMKLGHSKVHVPLHMGLPIEEYKKYGQDVILKKMMGQHHITSLSGNYEGQEVTLIIEDGEIHVEGVTSSLSLSYDVKDGNLVETELAEDIENTQGDYAIDDLGAGTFDEAVYEEGDLNSYLSTNIPLGTNSFIDRLIENISNHQAFADIREAAVEAGATPIRFRTREEFIKLVLQPELEKLINNPNHQPQYMVSWVSEEIDFTQEVLTELEAYFKEVKNQIAKIAVKAPNTKRVYLVGGGILFAYYYFKDLKNVKLPSNILEAPYYTSRGYLIANIYNELVLAQKV